ncbi:hypothetical protein TWF694_010075 [Orbilia ellipsospora]|uniref:WH1 domain-containing protein n=1 Tax=Orbilia ellipsospora TaxID=2528407 RepID=A0AAV9XBW7_9PEZI
MSLLLQKIEKQRVQKALASDYWVWVDAVARLYTCFPNDTKWRYSCISGCLVLTHDETEKANFFKIVDISPANRGVLWDQKICHNLKYCKDSVYFHSFENEDCFIGFSFADEQEAEAFRTRVLEVAPYPYSCSPSSITNAIRIPKRSTSQLNLRQPQIQSEERRAPVSPTDESAGLSSSLPSVAFAGPKPRDSSLSTKGRPPPPPPYLRSTSPIRDSENMALADSDSCSQPFPSPNQPGVHVHMKINITHLPKLGPPPPVVQPSKQATAQALKRRPSQEIDESTPSESFRNLFPPCKTCASRLGPTAGSGDIPSTGLTAPAPAPPPPPPLPEYCFKASGQSSIYRNPRESLLSDIRTGKLLNPVKPPPEKNTVVGRIVNSTISSPQSQRQTPLSPKAQPYRSSIYLNTRNDLLAAVVMGKSLNHVNAPRERNIMPLGCVVDAPAAPKSFPWEDIHLLFPNEAPASSNPMKEVCAAIRVGKQLNHVNPPRERNIVVGRVLNTSICPMPQLSRPPPPPPPPPRRFLRASDSRSGLLADIRAGKSLKKIDISQERSSVGHPVMGSSIPFGWDSYGLQAALEKALSNGRKAKGDELPDDHEDSDQDW